MNAKLTKVTAIRFRCDSDEEAVALSSYLDAIIPNGYQLDEPDVILLHTQYKSDCQAFHAGYWAGERNGHAAGLDEGREAAEREAESVS